ncbi:TerD family protein [Streptomyces sp. ODS28]|uniref:TerD family protein n=1 Tax=Streptomyces sp. ODS28 TaxID=3136688 RepID=UPI0031EEE7CC
MTRAMVKGSNVELKTGSVRAVLSWSPGPGGPEAPDIDASVLLLGEDDAVRWDEDFVFYNQPRHPSGLVRHVAKSRSGDALTDTVEAELSGLDPSVARVLLAASSDGGTFAGVDGLRLLLYAGGNGPDGSGDAGDAGGSGEALVRFDIEPETGSETAMLCGELYRRGDGWKFRALGQGYESGLEGLATEFGVSVDDEAAAPDPAAASPASAGAPTGSTPAPAAPSPSTPDTPSTSDPEAVTVPYIPGPHSVGPGMPAAPAHAPAHAPAAAAAASAGGGAEGTVPQPPHEPDFPEPDPVPDPGREPQPQPEPGPEPPGPPPGPPPEPPQPPPGQGGYAYPPPPQQPPSTRPAYGYPQPAYGYPQPDPEFTLPPQGPQFVGR